MATSKSKIVKHFSWKKKGTDVTIFCVSLANQDILAGIDELSWWKLDDGQNIEYRYFSRQSREDYNWIWQFQIISVDGQALLSDVMP